MKNTQKQKATRFLNKKSNAKSRQQKRKSMEKQLNFIQISHISEKIKTWK